MKTKLENVIYDVIRKRKMKAGETLVGYARALSGKRYKLVHSGKNKYMIPE
jgi:hypothetical protein